MNWQPIATAPKDESTVILFFPKRYWMTDEHLAFGFWCEAESDWFATDSDSASMTAFGSKPSHWMMPPEPPTSNPKIG